LIQARTAMAASSHGEDRRCAVTLRMVRATRR
jgi:hypothetical protein